MNNESTPTITEADIARIRQQVRTSALEVEGLIVANQLMAARIAELEGVIARGKSFVPRRPLKFAEAADVLKDVPGTPAQKADNLRRMMERRHAGSGT